MSNKARSRKRKDFIKVLKLAAKIAELRNKLHKIEEKYYPKLAPGGTVLHSKPYELQGCEMIVPVKSKGAHPYENEPYLFQFNS